MGACKYIKEPALTRLNIYSCDLHRSRYYPACISATVLCRANTEMHVCIFFYCTLFHATSKMTLSKDQWLNMSALLMSRNCGFTKLLPIRSYITSSSIAMFHLKLTCNFWYIFYLRKKVYVIKLLNQHQKKVLLSYLHTCILYISMHHNFIKIFLGSFKHYMLLYN